MKDATLSKKPKTLAVSPAIAIASSDSFSRDLARIIPRMEKGIAKEVKNRLPAPSQKEREISTLIIPNARLRIPLNVETPLIFAPPARNYDEVPICFPILKKLILFSCSKVKLTFQWRFPSSLRIFKSSIIEYEARVIPMLRLSVSVPAT
jgi:hypothetical protein